VKYLVTSLTCLALLLISIPVFGHSAATTVDDLTLPPPFTIEPFDTELAGNSAGNLLGSFRQDGGPEQFEYFIGTNITPGSVTMDFAIPFTDGPGNDFALLTGFQFGPLADMAQFDFYFGGNLRASFTAPLAPNQVFEFELPGDGLVVDRVVVTNVTPDLPGFDDDAGMDLKNAGAAYLVGEPVSIDIKPTSDSNRINLKNTGAITVAILSSPTFDATTVDPLSVKFGPGEALALHGKGSLVDVNGDGLSDLVLHFKTQETGIKCGQIFAYLTAKTNSGQAVAGFDLIQTIGCN
jgi:hypothetical protein